MQKPHLTILQLKFPVGSISIRELQHNFAAEVNIISSLINIKNNATGKSSLVQKSFLEAVKSSFQGQSGNRYNDTNFKY
jgi:hypothetical protein